MNSWTCDGRAKNGKKYRNKHRPGSHQPIENFGSACIECGLKKEQVFGKSPVKVILLVAAATAAGLSCLLWGIRDVIFTPPRPENYPYFKDFKDVPNVPQMKVRYGGSTSFAPLRSIEIVARIEQVHPGFTLSYVEPIPPEKPGSGSGIGMLIEGQLSVAQSSRPLQEEELAKASDPLKQVPVAIDSIAIYINPQVSVSSLTLAQLKDIFTGKITNWKDVGGADLSIVPVSRDPNDGGTPEFFKEEVMAGEPLAAAAQPYSRDTTFALRKVGSTPGAIGYGSAPEICNQTQVRTLSIAREAGQTPVAACDGLQVNIGDLESETYPITRRLFVIIRQDGNLDEQAGFAYANLLLSDEGQNIIQQKDFIPIRTIPARNL